MALRKDDIAYVSRVESVRSMYLAGIPTAQIGAEVGLKDNSVRRLITVERKRNPRPWPYRKFTEDEPDQDDALNPSRARRTTYLACEDLDLTWSVHEVLRFDELWRDGLHLQDIANELGRDLAEVMVLAVDRCVKGKIGERPGGVFGNATANR